MPDWNPGRLWEGEDAYVIGGGPSLSGFDWGLVKGKHTIGCNSAFVLGHHVVEVAVFGDFAWWQQIGKRGTDVAFVRWESGGAPQWTGVNDLADLGSRELEVGDLVVREEQPNVLGEVLCVGGLSGFGGPVVACCPKLWNDPTPWLLHMPRYGRIGFATERELGWNGNTGSLGISLALLLGARRVFLLGFDMKLGEKGSDRAGKMNWHDVRYEKTDPAVFGNFRQQLALAAQELPFKFPGVQVVNVTNDSDLEAFPKQTLAAHFSGRKVVAA